MKTSELTGAALDWAVAKCEGLIDQPRWGYLYGFKPSTDWAQGGPIIERGDISITPLNDIEGWIAHMMWRNTTDHTGPTPLIAAMRCYVASKLGDEVEIPEELQ